MERHEIDRLVARLGSAGAKGGGDSDDCARVCARLFDPLLNEEPGHLRALVARLSELAAAAPRCDDARLWGFLLDALQSLGPEGELAAALGGGGRLAEAARRLRRPLPVGGEAASHLLGLPGGKAAARLGRLYRGRQWLTPGQLAAAAELLGRRGGPGWLADQGRAWRANRGRPVPETLLPLVLAQRPQARSIPRARLVQAPGLDAGRLGLVRGLIARSAVEARSAYRLAARLSRATGAPTITLHNATLGGFSAWGVPGLTTQAGGSGLAREALRLPPRLRPDPALLAALIQRRLEALIRPRLNWLLSAFRTACEIEGGTGGGRGPYERWLAASRPFLGDQEPPRLSFPFRPRAEIEAALGDTLALAERELRELPERAALLAALWLAGRRLMAAGRISALVIPVADKFVASSRRGRDVGYLAATLGLLRDLAPEACCLLLDASSHPQAPSLRHTPARLRSAGIPALGLGIFSEDGARPRTLGEMVAHPGVGLFVLEPLRGEGRRGAERLAEGDRSLLTRAGYDPAWKEAVGWLAAGTRLAELADPWLPPPPEGGRVLTSTGPLAGGRLYRLAVRRRLGLAEEGGRGQGGALWRRWVRLARLD